MIGYAQHMATISRRGYHHCHPFCSSLNKMAIAWWARLRHKSCKLQTLRRYSKLKKLGLACLTQQMNQNWHDKCDCYQLLSLRNSDIHMSSVHGVGCEVVTLSNMSRGESEFSWQLWLLSILGFVEFRHSHVINAWCWICNWYILKFVKWYVVR